MKSRFPLCFSPERTGRFGEGWQDPCTDIKGYIRSRSRQKSGGMRQARSGIPVESPSASQVRHHKGDSFNIHYFHDRGRYGFGCYVEERRQDTVGLFDALQGTQRDARRG